jgi:NhaP-type Na+/H+ or K+/H+ antiporter
MAEDYAPQFFPPAVLRGLGIGILVGGLLGLIAGYLLLTNVITVPGWEGMYSLGETTFLSLWMVIGIAAGIVFIGISAILTAPNVIDVEVVEHRE